MSLEVATALLEYNFDVLERVLAAYRADKTFRDTLATSPRKPGSRAEAGSSRPRCAVQIGVAREPDPGGMSRLQRD